MSHAERLRNVLAVTPEGQATIRAAAAHIERLTKENRRLERETSRIMRMADDEIDAANARAAIAQAKGGANG